MPGQVAPAKPASPARPAASASSVLERAAVLGAATGMRSTVALAALILRRSDGLPAALRHPATRWIAAAADGAELVADKLPGTPSRLDPPGLIGRLIFASLAAAVLARSEHRGPIPSVLTGSVCRPGRSEDLPRRPGRARPPSSGPCGGGGRRCPSDRARRHRQRLTDSKLARQPGPARLARQPDPARPGSVRLRNERDRRPGRCRS